MKLLNFQQIKHWINYILFHEIQVFSLSLCLSKLWNHRAKKERKRKNILNLISYFKKDEKRENLKLDLEYNSQRISVDIYEIRKKYSKNIPRAISLEI